MRTYAQLTADEQQRAVQLQLTTLAVDDSLLADASVANALQRVATRRARAAIYVDPDDRLVTLPPAPVVP